jgi:hypothetical protein
MVFGILAVLSVIMILGESQTKDGGVILTILVGYLITAIGATVWVKRQALEAAKALMSPSCTSGSPATPSVQLVFAADWKFRFTNAAFAEAFAETNLGGKVTATAGRA